MGFNCLEAAFVLGRRAGGIVMQVDVCEIGNSVDVCEVGNSIDICEERSQYIGRPSYNSNEMCKQNSQQAYISSNCNFPRCPLTIRWTNQYR